MLWDKAWTETRWRFVIGLAIMACTALFVVGLYPRFLVLLRDAGQLALPQGPLGEEIRAQVAISSTFHGYAWSQYFAKNLPQQWVLFAAVIGTGGVVAQIGSGALFTLSLPASRERLLATRTLVGFAELAALAVAAAAIPSIVAPMVGQSFPLGEALTYAFSIVVGGLPIFALAVWLSTLFSDVWRPALIAIAAGFVMGVVDQQLAPPSMRVLTAPTVFHGQGPPWPGLAVSVALSALLFFAAARSLARRDF
jgi:ABC-type transport system involved in multi-copper enzyme maturation permease subunit